MLELIATVEQLEKEAKEIEGFLEITCSDDLDEIVERGNALSVYISRTSKMLADAGYHRDKAVSESIILELGKSAGIAPSVLNKLVDATCKRENYLYKWTERLNATVTHQLDWLRSLVSKAKEEMRLSSGVSGQAPRY